MEPRTATMGVFWKVLGAVLVGVLVWSLLGKLMALAVAAAVGFLAVGTAVTLLRRQPVRWCHVKANGVAAADRVARGCGWAAGRARDGVCWAWDKGRPAIRGGWDGCRQGMRRAGSVALETLSGAGLGGLAGGALSYAGGFHDTLIPLGALVGAAIGFVVGTLWSGAQAPRSRSLPQDRDDKVEPSRSRSLPRLPVSTTSACPRPRALATQEVSAPA